MEKNSITKRIDAITLIPEKYRHTILPAPKAVKIELSPRCNYRCGFCALRTRECQPTEDMDWGFFCRVAKEMKEAGVEELGMFYLGESFMNPKLLINAIDYAKNVLGFSYVFLTSNGSLASPKHVEACMEAGLDSLKWSVNAADFEQFEEVMGVKAKNYINAFKNIEQAYRIREAKGYKTGLYASSIRYDGDQQRKMEEIVTKVKPFVDEHYWLPLYSMGSLAEDRERELGYRPTAGNQGRLEAMREPLPCWSAFTEGHITANRKLSACCFDSDGRWSMADLDEVDFITGWNSLMFQKLREAHLKKDVSGTICEACVAYSKGEVK